MNNGNTNGFVHTSKPRISLRRFLFYFITLAALILIYLKFAELKLMRDVFLRSNLFWIFGAVVLQVLTYLFIALNYRDVLRVKDLNVSVKELYPLAFIIQFLNQALPSAGLSGNVFFIQYLKKFGLSIAEGIGRAILELTTLYMAFGSFFILSAVLMFRKDVLGHHPEARFFVYGFLFLAVIGISVFLLLQKRGRGRIARWFVSRFHRFFEKKNGNGQPASEKTKHVEMVIDQFKSSLSIGTLKGHRKAFWQAYAWQLIVLLLDILTLYFISFAVDTKINFSIAIIAFILTTFLSMLSFIPGALGIFEGGMTLILVSFGVPAEPAFAVTLLLRAFTFWLPMPFGWILYRWYTHKQELQNPYEDLPVNTGSR